MQITDLEVRPIDLGSTADLTAWGDFTTALEEELFGASSRFEPEHLRVRLGSYEYTEFHHLGAFAPDGSLVGTGTVEMSLAENLDRAFLEVEVLAPWRRRGLGALLADRIRDLAAAQGRPRIESWAAVPLEGDPDSADLPVNRLAARLGMRRRNLAVRRALDLPVAADRLAAARDLAAAASDGYRIETFRGPVPDRWARAVGLMVTQLGIDEPTEELEYEVAEFDEERMQVLSERRVASGADTFTALAIAPDGTPAGVSEVVWQQTPGTTIAWQGITLVMPEHRGHRLGLALKATTHAALPGLAPGLRRVMTWNSHVNPHMIAVNEALGYVAVGRDIAFQD